MLKGVTNLALMLALTIGAGALPVNAQRQDLRMFLVGTWRQQNDIGVTETVFDPAGSFESKLHTHLKGNAHPASVSGDWEIRRGSQLWMHNLSWDPTDVRFPDGSRRPIKVQPWDSTIVKIIDANHVRMNGGVATRVTR
jgi:hypothetical protein